MMMNVSISSSVLVGAGERFSHIRVVLSRPFPPIHLACVLRPSASAGLHTAQAQTPTRDTRDKGLTYYHVSAHFRGTNKQDEGYPNKRSLGAADFESSLRSINDTSLVVLDP
eukprot:scaffold38243_cov75-Cyclotella_meneghiniana.AAC.11